MAASFDEKVEALRRLREKRLQRTGAEAAAENSKNESTAAAAPAEAQSGPVSASSSTPAKPSSMDTDALFCAGHCCERGLHGCSQNFLMAAENYRPAAEEGHSAAQWRLGELLERGLGVAKDESEAAVWYQKAATAGNIQAQTSLALLLEEGKGLPSNKAEALSWHLKAAQGGQAVSQYCASRILAADGEEEAAEDWLRRSAAQGFPPAQDLLLGSRMTEEAEDVSLLNLAGRLAERLAELGDGEAEELLDAFLAEVYEEEGEELSHGL